MSQRIEMVLDDQGRLVLPSSLRRELGLTTGATLVVERQTKHAAYLRGSRRRGNRASWTSKGF